MKVLKPRISINYFYHLAGAAFIFLNYLRHSLLGYRIKAPFSKERIKKYIEYDFQVVENWLRYLECYVKETDFLKGKVVLELGPGADLGIGLILLGLGAKKYIAVDVHKLVKAQTEGFYRELLVRIKERIPACDIALLAAELSKCLKGVPERLVYLVDPEFDLKKIDEGVDIVFSQAAFEHFDHPSKTFEELKRITSNNAVLITEIDLQTHTGWIKDKDPLNIYRYSTAFYNLLKFKGSPNRLRVFEYKKLLSDAGWEKIEVSPLTVLDEEYLKKVCLGLSNKFRNLDFSELSMLHVMLAACKR